MKSKEISDDDDEDIDDDDGDGEDGAQEKLLVAEEHSEGGLPTPIVEAQVSDSENRMSIPTAGSNAGRSVKKKLHSPVILTCCHVIQNVCFRMKIYL